MIHGFDVEVAKSYGVNSAVILYNIYFWVEKNKANETHYYDGNYWTYNSNKAFSKIFPYFTEKQIFTAINNLISNGIIIKGNYSENKYDRTSWYALTEKGYAICKGIDTNDEKGKMHFTYRENGYYLQEKSIEPTGKMDITSMENRFDTEGKSIYIYNTDNKPTDSKQSDIISDISKKERKKSTYDDILGEFDISDKDLIDAIYDFIKMRKMIKKPMTDRALRMVINKIRDIAPNDIKTQIKILEQSIMNSWQGVFPLQTEQTRRHFNGDVIVQKGRKYEFKNGDWFLVGGNNIPVDPFRDDDDDFPF